MRYRLSGRIANLISLCPLDLPSLFQWFGSDKQQPGWHSYGPTYQTLFRPWKYRRLKLLEIGIGGYGESLGGASLLAWQAFFPFGTVYGADIQDKRVLAAGRRRILHLDQSSPSSLIAARDAEGPFDIIIDDGSHMNAHQILTFEHMFESLKDGGIYVVEDIQTSFWPGLVAGVTWDGAAFDGPDFGKTCHGYFLELAKYLNQAEFPDKRTLDPRLSSLAASIRHIMFSHNMITIHKGPNHDKSTFV